MGTSIKILLPLLSVVLVESRVVLNTPLFGIDVGGTTSDANSNNPSIERESDNSYSHGWVRHYTDRNGPKRRQDFNGNVVSHNRHPRRQYNQFDPYYDGVIDPYFNPYFGNHGFGGMPQIQNIFSLPGHNYDSNESYESNEKNPPEEKPVQTSEDKEKPEVVSPTNNAPMVEDKTPNRDQRVELINEGLPPKTNAIKTDNAPKDKDKKDDKSVDLDEKKDYLLVGSGNNANNVYLLHENKPNVAVPNGNQPTNNVIYIPYNPGQPSNQLYQVVNGQPILSSQVTPDKANANNGGYNNGITNPGQPVINPNTPNDNSNYVLIYSNGQIIKIPGVVINQQPNNVPLQNGNQGSSIIVANPVPNLQNPGQNVIYAAIPNQGTSGQIVVQLPSCVQNVPNVCGSGAVVMNPVQGVTNGQPNNVVLPTVVTNGYVQPNVANPIPDQGQNVVMNVPNQPVLNTPNVPVQPAVNNGGYNQPMVTNPVQNPTEVVNAPNTALPNNNGNGYTQPIVSNPGNQGVSADVNIPSHDVVFNAPSNDQPVLLPATTVPGGSAIILDDSNLASLGAQPAIMISSFKETKDDQDKNSGEKKDKKDKSKKKNKKNKDGDKKDEQKKESKKKK